MFLKLLFKVNLKLFHYLISEIVISDKRIVLKLLGYAKM